MAKKRTKKKTKTKTKAKPKTKGLGIGTVRSTKNVSFRKARRKPSEYQPIFDQMAKLKNNQSFLVDVPRGVDVQVMHNRLTAAMQRCGVKPPRGCHFRKRTTEEGKIAIYCERA